MPNLEEIDAALDGAKARWDHGDAPYDPDALALIRAAEAMRAHIASIHGDNAADPMPVFVIKADSKLALQVANDYADVCEHHGLEDARVQAIRAFDEFSAWQERNPAGMPSGIRASVTDAVTVLSRS